MSDLAYIGLDSSGFLTCSGNPTHENNLVTHWCAHIKNYIASGEDTIMLHADQHIQVPIFPTADVYGEVWIGEDKFGTGSAIMSLNFTPDIGRPYSVKLGFWNPGEGMASIRAVIIDFVRSRTDPEEKFNQVGPIKTKCPSTIHNLRESRVIEERATQSLLWKWQCIWNMVMEKACTPCMEASSGDTGDNFGVDESVIPKPRWSGSSPF